MPSEEEIEAVRKRTTLHAGLALACGDSVHLMVTRAVDIGGDLAAGKRRLVVAETIELTPALARQCAEAFLAAVSVTHHLDRSRTCTKLKATAEEEAASIYPRAHFDFWTYDAPHVTCPECRAYIEPAFANPPPPAVDVVTQGLLREAARFTNIGAVSNGAPEGGYVSRITGVTPNGQPFICYDDAKTALELVGVMEFVAEGADFVEALERAIKGVRHHEGIPIADSKALAELRTTAHALFAKDGAK